MVVGKLVRAGDEYQVTEPRVLNPPGPTSADGHERCRLVGQLGAL